MSSLIREIVLKVEDGHVLAEELFVQRLSAAIEHAGGAAAVAARSDVPLKTVYNWKAGKNAAAAITLARIAAACRRPVTWFYGIGAKPDQEFNLPLPAGNVVEVPILDVTAGAGWGVENGEPEIRDMLPFPKTVLQRLGIRPEKVRGLRSGGDSMWPTIGDGQLVLIDTGVTDLHDGRIYAISAPDGLRLKRIQRQMDGSVVLISDNKELYQPEPVPKHEAMNIRVVGRAFWTEKLL